MPIFSAAAREATTSAAAPSVMPLELPAVTEPRPSLRNAGWAAVHVVEAIDKLHRAAAGAPAHIVR